MEINEKKHKKEQQELIIRKYQQYLKLEKSLSLNTLDAYLTDLDKLMSFLTLEGIYVLDVCLSDLQRFAAGLHDIGIHPRSQARILSGIKSFFRFLILENYLEADPSELLEGPKIGFKLPEVLTVEEIDRIISAVDRSKAEGQRNRAILETLYSCGLGAVFAVFRTFAAAAVDDGAEVEDIPAEMFPDGVGRLAQLFQRFPAKGYQFFSGAGTAPENPGKEGRCQTHA